MLPTSQQSLLQMNEPNNKARNLFRKLYYKLQDCYYHYMFKTKIIYIEAKCLIIVIFYLIILNSA